MFLLGTPTVFAEESVRPFPIPTLEALGRQLYRQDLMAANAFDTLFEAVPEAKDRKIKGWITRSDGEQQSVYILEERDGRMSLGFGVTFPDNGKPAVEDLRGAELPKDVATRLAARRTAIDAIPQFMTEQYNFEVLDDPERKGAFLVYGLASTRDPNAIVVGGHYRVSVSPDGAKATEVDALSRSLLVLPKKSPDMPEGAETAGHVMSHIVSDTPVETHVFVSLQHNTPLYVATSEKDLWKVTEGKISRVDKTPNSPTP